MPDGTESRRQATGALHEAPWLRTAVRTKPYILQEAAQQCKELAGRLTIQIQEIKKVTA
ncbi:hypothetical protein CTTA_2891 [Comamonas testosteroni]|uniref:Uncharacterized protein n=1 Tax=Comamonas testosteroni TaxID=285 RepID=A0A5A7MDX4_COMTE|nr:hypothetical protein CTTA_2891 [Comamonas testosteroni]